MFYKMFFVFQGGNQFILILNEHLPADFEVGYACFGESARVGLKKVNEINLTGIVPGKFFIFVPHIHYHFKLW